MDDLSRFCCLNSDCPEHGRRGAGNLTVCHRYGPGKSRRMLRCRACKARFSERKGTPLFGSHLPDETAVAVMNHLAEGVGLRKTGRLVGVHRETAARYGRKAGAHAKALHDELVAVSPPDARGPVRREVGLRRQEGEALRPR
jgi:LacI family transcriptional regulator